MFVNKGKIVIIGTSNVGSAVLNKIADFQLASEIALIDLNQDKATGEALDSSHATSCIYSTNIDVHLGTYEDCKDAGIIIITAGPSIRPGETPDRLRLAGTNAKIMRSVMGEIVKYTKDAMIIMITNPLDVATTAYPLNSTIRGKRSWVPAPCWKPSGSAASWPTNTAWTRRTSTATYWVSTATQPSRPGAPWTSPAWAWTTWMNTSITRKSSAARP